MSRRILVTLLGMLAIAGLSGCSNNPTSASMGTMNIQMTDAPGDFQSVNLVVNEVAVQSSSGNGGWEILSSQTRTYDLLQLRNGVFTTLGISQLPAGHYGQLRLKLVGSFDVPQNGRVDLALDFDVARSILPDGDGAYALKPVLRIVTISVPENKPGSIHGVVAPTGCMASVFVIQNADTVASTLTGADGNFTVLLLPAGTYQLAFHAREGYQDQMMNGVVVATNAMTDVGTVTLSPVPPPPPTQGAISGHVMPQGVPTMVSVMASGNVVAQAAVANDGAFLLAGLPAGSYDLRFEPSADYMPQTRSAVAVVAGQTNDIGMVTLEPVPPPPSPGTIVGQIVPAGIPCTVSAMQGTVTVTQVSANMDGTFSLGPIPAGTYTVVVHPLFDFADSTIPGVVVSSGGQTNLGQIQLSF